MAVPGSLWISAPPDYNLICRDTISKLNRVSNREPLAFQVNLQIVKIKAPGPPHLSLFKCIVTDRLLCSFTTICRRAAYYGHHT